LTFLDKLRRITSQDYGESDDIVINVLKNVAQYGQMANDAQESRQGPSNSTKPTDSIVGQILDVARAMANARGKDLSAPHSESAAPSIPAGSVANTASPADDTMASSPTSGSNFEHIIEMVRSMAGAVRNSSESGSEGNSGAATSGASSGGC
jgi:hypothetical protein